MRRKRQYNRKASTAKKALSIARKNKRILGRREIKKNQQFVAPTEITASSGSVVYLSDVDTGDGNDTREGDEVQSRFLHVKYAVREQDLAEDSIILVKIFRKDVQINQVPTMYNTPTSDVLENGNPLSSLDRRNSEKYTVLHTQLFIGSPGSTQAWVKDVYIDLRNKKNHYLSTGGGTADAGNGSYWIGFYTDTTAGATHQPKYTLYSRYAFSDL